MQVIADLQLHSRFSRAVSKEMTIPNIARWAVRKGIGLIATGDWTHPIWFREIERDLEEIGNGLLRLKSAAPEVGASFAAHPSSPSLSASVRTQTKGMTVLEKPHLPGAAGPSPLFLLATEVSSIYSQGGRVRRVHTLIWVPTLESARKINTEMTRRGCNLMSDGRPIIGLTSIQVAELVLAIEPKALIIPAHCLLPEAQILQDGFTPVEIQKVRIGERVLTHTGQFRRVTEVKRRLYKGDVLTVQPWYFHPGLMTTPEHPYYAIKTLKKCSSTGDVCRPSAAHLTVCKEKACLLYAPSWIQAKNLEIGDVLVYPRTRHTVPKTQVRLTDRLSELQQNSATVHAGGTRGRRADVVLRLTPELGRLLGYFLAEGSTDAVNSFSFCFSSDEVHYIQDVVTLVKDVFGLEHPRPYRRKYAKSVELTYYSKIHAIWLAAICYEASARRAYTKKVPEFLFEAGEAVQAECLRGWYRGDKGYTSSRRLMNQIKAICLRLGIIPSVLVDTSQHHASGGRHFIGDRTIQARHPSFALSNFSFFSDEYDLKKEMPRSQTKFERKHGWVDKNNVYLPIRDITRSFYEGEVYNLEVERDHSYVAEFAAVHNCWTPWFSVYGALGGFDSIEEAFGPYAKNIYAVETGLSSNPAMNWRIAELDSRAIVSFSDAHSGPKLGREATVFEISDQLSDISYQHIYDAITAASLKAESRKLKAHIAHTIEFYPEEGKYHYTGHRTCRVRQSPAETQKKGTTCPVCGKPLTVGVMHRVEELALRPGVTPGSGKAGRTEKDLKLEKFRKEGIQADFICSKAFPNRPPFVMLVTLLEILAEAMGAPVTSPKVQILYQRLTESFGGEFNVLLKVSIGEIVKVAGARVAEGIEKVRKGDIIIDPGYDGVFGVVKIWQGEEGRMADRSQEQLTIFKE